MFDQYGRPDWDSYFMAMCFLIAQRSLDPSTKHGCVIVDDSHTILSVGYNSPPRGSFESEIPLTRPEKYPFMEHSESNAIINAARTGTSLVGGTAYITGCPCENCFRKLMGVGIKNIIVGPQGSHMLTPEMEKVCQILNAKGTVNKTKYIADNTVPDIFKRATDAFAKTQEPPK